MDPQVRVFSARFHDTKSKETHSVEVRILGEQISVRFADDEKPELFWSIEDITIESFGFRSARVTNKHSKQSFQLDDDAFVSSLSLKAQFSIGMNWAKQFSWIIAFVAFVLLIGFTTYKLITPTAKLIASQIPIEYEKKMADLLVGQLTKFKVCAKAEGDKALRELTERIAPEGSTIYDYEIKVVKAKEVNAFALMGGTIIINSGILEFMESPEELAGVLAHEMQHIENRHVMTQLVRSSVLTAAWSLLAGDVSGFIALDPSTIYMLASLKFSRDMENEADEGALRMLSQAHISTKGVADFFERLKKDRFEPPAILSTHPDSDERAKGFRRFARTQSGVLPALNKTEWLALQGICN
jgi:predicted Zn-dependent protease